jgi:di/tricarboxylate transporter
MSTAPARPVERTMIVSRAEPAHLAAIVTVRLRKPAMVLAADGPKTGSRFLPLARNLIGAGSAVAATSTIWLGLPWLAPEARFALGVFCVALIGWIVLDADDTLVALAAAAALVVSGTIEADVFYRALGDELIWLLVAAFIIGGALKACDLTDRLAATVLRPVRTVAGLFLGLTLFIVATALVIPSTSGRAALLLPVFVALTGVIRDARIIRALALLFPTIILLSAGGSLIGAGAHLIALEAIGHLNGPRLDYAGWLVIGTPLALATSLAATAIILAMFVGVSRARSRIDVSLPAGGRLTRSQAYVLAVVALMVGLWLSEPVHGIEMAIVAVAGALMLAVQPLSGIALKDALKGIEWSLLLFLAATLVLTNALIETDAALRLAKVALREIKPYIRDREALAAVAVAAIAIASHLIIPSRSARAAILIPAIALPLSGLGLNASAFVLIAVMGTGFCQTLPSSAKPLAIFGQLEAPTFGKSDLLKLSLVLMPVVLALVVIFAVLVWPHQGLPLARPR